MDHRSSNGLLDGSGGMCCFQPFQAPIQFDIGGVTSMGSIDSLKQTNSEGSPVELGGMNF